jgi:DNA-binding transcriptional MerR regulator
MTTMTIGELGRRVGLRPSAIRYYEAQGVLRPAARAANDYRHYGPEAVSVLRFVQRAKALGLSLAEVRQIMAASRHEPPCALTRKLVACHLAEVDAELRRLQALRDRLSRLLDEPAPAAADMVCPLIETEPSNHGR